MRHYLPLLACGNGNINNYRIIPDLTGLITQLSQQLGVDEGLS